MKTTKPMKITISQEAYERYRQREHTVSNSRLRAKNEDFFDALLSVDMTATPERRATLEAIRKLN